MSPTALEEVQSRIAAIQNRIGVAPTSDSLTTGAALGNSTPATFQAMLKEALNNGAASSDLSSALQSLLSSAGGSVSGQDIVSDAQQYLGTPYVWGGTDPAKGLDCSGLVQRVYADMGISMPRVAADQARQGTAVPSLAQAKPGDLVAFGSPVDHIGIYAGNNKMIVAPHRGDVVKVQEVYTTPTAIRRIVDSDSGSTATSANFGSLSSAYNSQFVAAGNKYNISPMLLAAVAKQESGFNPNAGSGAGAQGLMQLMPATARSLGVNAYDPNQAIDGAAKMLSGLVTKFGSTSLALAAYNAGPGAVQKYNGIPPYAETQRYVKNITAMVQQAGGSVK